MHDNPLVHQPQRQRLKQMRRLAHVPQPRHNPGHALPLHLPLLRPSNPPNQLPQLKRLRPHQRRRLLEQPPTLTRLKHAQGPQLFQKLRRQRKHFPATRLINHVLDAQRLQSGNLNGIRVRQRDGSLISSDLVGRETRLSRGLGLAFCAGGGGDSEFGAVALEGFLLGGHGIAGGRGGEMGAESGCGGEERAPGGTELGETAPAALGGHGCGCCECQLLDNWPAWMDDARLEF